MSRIVFTNGCFDVLHIGHVRLLKFACQQGTHLIVGLNSDDSVRQLKGEGRPINGQAWRKEVLESIRYINEVIIFDETNVVKLMENINPDVWVKGGDYTVNTLNPAELAVCHRRCIAIRLFPAVGDISTTLLLNKHKS
jgi:rfaE bifunctional protein nucleotidyltransferase chain/domain